MDRRMSIAFLAPAEGSSPSLEFPRIRQNPAPFSHGSTANTPVQLRNDDRAPNPMAMRHTHGPTQLITLHNVHNGLRSTSRSPQNSPETANGYQRAPRPSYSEEQKFLIMYCRVTRGLSWPEIEDFFAEVFSERSVGGLTSVYYRIRKQWGMEEVLKTGPEGTEIDRRVVDRKARNFSHAFLASIGYFN